MSGIIMLVMICGALTWLSEDMDGIQKFVMASAVVLAIGLGLAIADALRRDKQ